MKSLVFLLIRRITKLWIFNKYSEDTEEKKGKASFEIRLNFVLTLGSCKWKMNFPSSEVNIFKFFVDDFLNLLNRYFISLLHVG